MTEQIIIDDSAKITIPNAPTIVYEPPESWKENVICAACNIPTGAATARLSQTASSGTWTNAWWGGDQKVLTASLTFQGSDIAADFILFYRSGDVNGSTGESSLRFAIDGVEKLNKRMVASDYTFQNDFVQQQRMFSDSNLDPNANHTLRIQWTHDGVRPLVAVALDSIRYNGTLPQSGSQGTSTSNSGNSSKGSNSSNIAKIVAPTVVAVVAVLALLGLLLSLWLKRQKKRRSKARLIVDPGSPDHTSEMQLHAQSHWNATLYNRPGSMYLDQPYDSNSSMTAGLLGTAVTAGANAPRADPAFSPPPYADTDTSSSSISHPAGAGVPRQYPTPVTKSRLAPTESRP